MGKRNMQIEGLRGICVLMIALFHFYPRYHQLFLNSDVVWMNQWGTFGVYIFLLISCFLMSSLSVERIGIRKIRLNRQFGFIKYVLQKIVRLWPCYAVSITITAIIMHFFPLPGRESSAMDWLVNLTFLNGYVGIAYVDAAHWYLTTLIALTVVCGLMKKLETENNPLAYIFWLAGCAGLLYCKNMDPVARLIGGSYAGVAVCGIAMKKMISAEMKITWLLLMVLGFTFTLVFEGILKSGLLAAGIVLVYFTVQQKIKLLECGVLQWLGNISYPLYLVHQNMGYAIMHWLREAKQFNVMCAGLIALVAVVAIGWLLYVCVEYPSQRWISARLKNKG